MGVPANIVKHNKDVQLKNYARNKRIVDLRIAGMSEADIAEEITRDGRWGSISDTSIHRIVCAWLDKQNKTMDFKYDQLRRAELIRLDKLTVALFANRNDPRVADSLLRIMDRRAKYLGLDSPLKIEASNTNRGETKHDVKIDFTKLPDDKLDQLLALIDEATKSSE